MNSSIDLSKTPIRPSKGDSFSELQRASFETFSLALNMKRIINQSPKGNGQPVLTLPGYGGGDGSMLAVRYYLNKLNYRAFELSLGRNFESADDRIRRIEDAVAFREKMSSAVAKRVETIYQETGQKVTLVGWSMGGLYALDVSQQLSDNVAQIITLGTPFGDPRATSMWELMRKISRSKVAVEDMDFSGWMNKLILTSTELPIHVIYSEKDGIVPSHIAKLPDHNDVSYHQVNGSHVGFAFNHEALAKIGEILNY